ncbi:hypothetical protein Cgig2_007017 [Carnegiea gigantea]|uniref:Uncharacterized protein n=1 Tax=Carnegiea gigantea TaxID=171969 RepID=A0A9Q1QGD2_9CARY|nr:hypothetical protein Cgig2_007017 [Carnegiea gigantea]
MQETRKFKIELKKTLEKDIDAFGDELDKVVGVCAKVGLSISYVCVVDVQTGTGLAHSPGRRYCSKEYGGPGTVLVEPFTYMLIALKDNGLPGAALAARASLLWAQDHIDHDWQRTFGYQYTTHLPTLRSDKAISMAEDKGVGGAEELHPGVPDRLFLIREGPFGIRQG